MFTLLILVALITVLCSILYLCQQRYRYWKKRNVPHPQPVPILGNFGDFILLKENLGKLTQKLCKQFSNEPFFGAFYGTEPTLIVQDPDIIKLVMTKDFYYFSGREISKYNQKELLVQNLFFNHGDKWKVMRQNLTPIFSSSKMKKMFHLIEKCSRTLEDVLDKEIKISNVFEVRSLMARFTMDCVGSCAFGVDVNTLEQKEGNSFSDIGNSIFDISICFQLFGAAYETSATTLSFTLFELAKNPEAQEKVLKEVDSYLSRHNNVLKYECVAEMPYLDACIDESLRLYPALLILTREVMEDYILPNGLRLEKGMRIHLPVYHLHYNPDFFPEPEQYRPERFFGEEKLNVKPYTYLPFGEGPRICPGMRFAKMQMVAGLITLLKKYRLGLADDMGSSVQLRISTMVAQTVGGIRLKFIEREDWEQRLLQEPSLDV